MKWVLKGKEFIICFCHSLIKSDPTDMNSSQLRGCTCIRSEISKGILPCGLSIASDRKQEAEKCLK